MRILIADDDYHTLVTIRRMLQPFGRRDTAMTGLEALDRFREALAEDDPYGLVVLDIVMPQVDGLAALEKMHQLQAEHGIPEGEGAVFLIATGLTDSGVRRRAQEEFKPHAYINKPVDLDGLTNLLVRLGVDQAEDASRSGGQLGEG